MIVPLRVCLVKTRGVTSQVSELFCESYRERARELTDGLTCTICLPFVEDFLVFSRPIYKCRLRGKKREARERKGKFG